MRWHGRSFLAVIGALSALALSPSHVTAQAPPAAEAHKATVEPPPGPVDWLPFSPEVFERARKEGRGVLLTIVSKWCRPCSTADEDVYSDPGVRTIIAKRWIPVRIDRDDRPDVDSRYQMAASWFSKGKSGLPITAFLFHTGEAMWADGYIPLEDREARPGLRSLLVSSDLMWRNRFSEAQQNAKFVQLSFDEERRPLREVPVSRELLSAVVDETVESVDHDHGGFGAAPRVANPYAARLALLASMRRRDDGMRDLAVQALKAAISGAGFDRIDGGFHRAARDEGWTVAQWDKPLSVNAAYLLALTEAYSATRDAEISEAARKTIDFILGRLSAPSGGFYFLLASSSDLHDEAGYYTWTIPEAKRAIAPDDLKWARAFFGLSDAGELLLGLPPRFTLKVVVGVDDAARSSGATPDSLRLTSSRIIESLATVRRSKPAPLVLEARYLDSTSLAASALIHAGAVFDRRDAIIAAVAALDAILKDNPDSGRGIRHRLDAGGGSDSPVLMADHALCATAFLDAYEITGEPRFLTAAGAVASLMRSSFLDTVDGGFFDIVPDPNATGYLRIPRKQFLDSGTPSPAGNAAILFARLAARSGDESLQRVAEGSVRWALVHNATVDERSATLGLALDALLAPRVRIRIVGRREAMGPYVAAAFGAYAPGRVIEWGDAEAASATVCVGPKCREGITNPEEIAGAITALRGAAALADSVAAP